MNVKDFFQHVGAELVGGRFKCFYNGVHTAIADFIDGTPQLTKAGQQLRSQVEATLEAGQDVLDVAEPAAVTAAKVAEGAAIAAAVKDPALAAIATQAAGTVTDDLIDAINREIRPAPDTPVSTTIKAAPVITPKAKKA